MNSFITRKKSVTFVRQNAPRVSLLILLLLSFLSIACQKGEAVDPTDPAAPGTPSRLPAGVAGKWLYGTFSLGSFWGTDSSYQGSGYEQSMALDFKANGTFEMYVVNVATSYSCRTAAYTQWKGKVNFNEADHSVTLTPTEGTYRGEYGCTPNNNFKRAASAAEVAKAVQTFYYQPETDAKGSPALRLYFGTTDNQGAQFERGNW